MWDSGRVKSDQSVLVPYKGAALKEMTVYQVQVSVWDNYGELGQVTGNFETGLMREENWNAKWIPIHFRLKRLHVRYLSAAFLWTDQ